MNEHSGEESFTIQTVAKMFNDPASFPVVDTNRSESNREVGREVIQELGVITAYFPARDWWGRLPLRLSHNQAAGLVLELGTLDLDEGEVILLKRAVGAWEDCNESSPTTTHPDQSTPDACTSASGSTDAVRNPRDERLADLDGEEVAE